jgi:Tfp pilus assembly protein PilP
MKAIATISTMIMAAGMAAGQAYPASYAGQASPAYKPAAPASQGPAKATTTAAKPAAKLGAASSTAAAKPRAATTTTAAAKASAAKPSPAQALDSSRGRRDPFVSPVVVRMGESTGSCSTGKRCLVIDQLTVQGVVKTNNGWIAVIGNPSKKVYYVRENDALYDGFVTRITTDSVVFRQNVVDTMGKSIQKEVVKRITPSA